MQYFNKIAVPLGFILEVSLFTTAGYNIGIGSVYHSIPRYTLGTVLFIIGFIVALFVGELIKRKV